LKKLFENLTIIFVLKNLNIFPMYNKIKRKLLNYYSKISRNFLVLCLAVNIFFPSVFEEKAIFICRKTIENYITGYSEIIPENLPEIFNKPIPVFVSLKKGNQTRGCSGSFKTETGTLAGDLIKFSIIAATEDYRYRPVDLQELKDIKIQITIPEIPVEISSISFYNPENEGLIVKKSGKQGLVLPKEAKTGEYALKMCLRNAGINDEQGITIFKFKAKVFIEGEK